MIYYAWWKMKKLLTKKEKLHVLPIVNIFGVWLVTHWKGHLWISDKSSQSSKWTEKKTTKMVTDL